MSTPAPSPAETPALQNRKRAPGRILTRLAKRMLRTLAHVVAGAVLVLIVGLVVYVRHMPELKVWHTAELDAEYTASSPVNTFEDYLALEERLFAQLDEKVCARIDAEDRYEINRFNRGSRSDPGVWSTNWNRTFEFPVEAPRAGVLLLHGLSDSPYSLRRLGERLRERGVWVVGLRLPGHGTAPCGLVTVQWEDMAAAVAIAARRVRDKCGDEPFHIVGYSNGGALAVLHALSALDDAALPMPQRLVLISPEIGVTKLAGLAAWQERLGQLLGVRKLSWNGIGAEYDPFKYNSFALNAGKQAHRITAEIQARIRRVAPDGTLSRFPPVLAFQSVVDATVSAPALVEGLFVHLPEGESELVVFDINRLNRLMPILQTAPRDEMATLLKATQRRFTLTALTTENVDSNAVVARTWQPGAERGEVTADSLAWPADVYSLSHVALPFASDDPLYGCPDPHTSPGIQLGAAALRGERGILHVSAADMLRLRYNPFYSYLEARALKFMGLVPPEGAIALP